MESKASEVYTRDKCPDCEQISPETHRKLFQLFFTIESALWINYINLLIKQMILKGI